MNNVSLIGRLTRDPDIRHTQSGHTVARFTLAVDAGKDREADFIPCQAWDKTAEVVEKCIGKGRQIGVTGSLKSGSYDDRDTGKKIRTLDVNVARIDFCGSRDDAGTTTAPQERAQTRGWTNTAPRAQTATQRQDGPLAGFMDIPDMDEELPFN